MGSLAGPYRSLGLGGTVVGKLVSVPLNPIVVKAYSDYSYIKASKGRTTSECHNLRFLLLHPIVKASKRGVGDCRYIQ